MFRPPFCPRRECHYHHLNGWPGSRWWSLDGHYHCSREGQVQRFRCRGCGHRFSRTTFSLHYFCKRRLDYRLLLRLLVDGMSQRGCARTLGSSVCAVACRICRLVRQGLWMHANLCGSIVPGEALCADGFQSFWVSQYAPNNLNLLVGATSQFVYGLTAATLRRSGRMSVAQRTRRQALEALDRADPGELRRSIEELFTLAATLWSRCAPSARRLITDSHRLYAPALARLALGSVSHLQISSHRPRTLSNPLFSVNYIDREIRKDLAEHRRETVCIARSAAASLSRLWLYLAHHNYCKPYRILPRSPLTHAEVAGVDRSLLVRHRRKWLTQRAFLSRTALTMEMLRVWVGAYHTPFSVDCINRRLTPAHCCA